MKKIILSIDDDKDTLALEELVLSKAGYEVYTVQSGPEALLKIQELEHIDLILLDYEMDPMNGPEFLVALEKQSPERFKNIHVVYLTAHDDLPSKSNNDWIPKMRDLDKFVSDVGRLI